MRNAIRLAVLMTAWFAGSGCVYYNGIYNAQAEAKGGDARLRADDDANATMRFQRAAAIAESVLVRHPESKWRTRALYIAARSGALASQCERAMPRLLALLNDSITQGPQLTVAERDQSQFALATCEVRNGRSRSARSRLDSLIDGRSQDPELLRQSRIWAARAALGMGDRDAVTAYLAALNGSVLQWELIGASLAAREYARVESLLVLRARQGDYRDDVSRALRELFADGRFDAAERIVLQYDGARIRDESRARMHFALGDMHVRLGRDSLARLHLYSARTLAGRDSLTGYEANARLALIDVARLSSIRELDTLVARQDSVVWRTAYAQLLAERVLLFRLLAARDANADATGASLYLAAEIARDSLRAPRLAQTLFMRVLRERPASVLVPNAWYAASLLEPDSAAAWRGRILAEHGQSAVAARLRGDDVAALPDFISTADLLNFNWNETLRLWSDSVRKLRNPPRGTGR